MTCYTNARPGAGLLVVDLDLEALLERKFCDPLERLLAVDGELR